MAISHSYTLSISLIDFESRLSLLRAVLYKYTYVVGIANDLPSPILVTCCLAELCFLTDCACSFYKYRKGKVKPGQEFRRLSLTVGARHILGGHVHVIPSFNG